MFSFFIILAFIIPLFLSHVECFHLTVSTSDVTALSSAVACLGLPNPPSFYVHSFSERLSHYLSLQRLISSLIPPTFPPFCWHNYCGPWIEDLWNSTQTLPFSRFGAFVPVFVPYVLFWAATNSGNREYVPVLSKIFRFFQPNYIYVTVSHNDEGIDGIDNGFDLPANLLVFSQGGKGHIPLLLWLDPLNSSEYPIPASYRYDIVFMGLDNTSWVRKPAIKSIRRYFGNRTFVGESSDWSRVYALSKFVLTPRGYGRNSYRLGEVLQMGMLPVYVYDDFVWLPYYDAINWSSFAFVLKLKEVDGALPRIKSVTVEEAREMRMRVQRLYETHFSPDAVMHQILDFLQFGFVKSDLRCAKYSSVRAEA
jgi:hypothetical protein